MLDDLLMEARGWLGLDEDELEARHMALRAVVVFIFSIVVVRLGKKRFIGENTAFDLILGVLLGSTISRAITGQSPFFPTLTAVVVILALHWFISQLAVRWEGFGTLVKGRSRVLVSDGKVDWSEMKSGNISENDLREALRLKARISDWNKVKEARLERNGEISVILQSD